LIYLGNVQACPHKASFSLKYTTRLARDPIVR
jgi:hypothetical protein